MSKPPFLEMKLWMNRGKSKYCMVRLYRTKIAMQRAYKKYAPNDINHYKTLGCHCGHTIVKISKTGRNIWLNDTGLIFLNMEYCGAGIVTHEIMHSILWARNHKPSKAQYPIIIKNMEEEENMLQDFTFAVQYFYNWYWKVEKD